MLCPTQSKRVIATICNTHHSGLNHLILFIVLPPDEVAQEIDRAPGDEMDVPEAHVRIADQAQALDFGVAVHAVDLHAENRPADGELGPQDQYVGPESPDLQREVGHGEGADDDGEAVEQIGEVQRLPEVE